MKYDYVILGGGASGLSLAHRMSQTTWFADKSIAIIEKDVKNKNDRTWSFWEEKPGYYDHIVSKRWPKLDFFSSTLEKRLDIKPFEYKMIRGIDFYAETAQALAGANNIDRLHAEIHSVEDTGTSVKIVTSAGLIEAGHAFKSYPSATVSPEEHLYVDQHFKGFVIETAEDTFDPDVATFMDFRIEQEGEVRFLYVLPTTARSALVEVAIFSNNILTQKAYDRILEDYIEQYIGVESYTVVEEEYGVIPMTPYPFHKHNSSNVTHIGTGGGIFTDLFAKKKGSLILKFLKHDTSFFEELNIFTAPPWWPFTKAFFKEVVF